MLSSDPRYGNYLKILQEELVPATGCTEPIAIAYGAAKARELLGVLPESVLVEASGNIIKNVKSVVVPNTNSLKGIEAAQKAFQEDMAAVDQEAREEQARQSFAAPANSGVRRPRPMI